MSTELSPELSLVERLRALTPGGWRSDFKEETPLWVFLYIYMKAGKESYIDYMHGAKALRDFLGPVSFTFGDGEVVGKVPALLRANYELSELARLFCTSPQHTHLEEWRKKEDAIYHALTKKMPEGFNESYQR